MKRQLLLLMLFASLGVRAQVPEAPKDVNGVIDNTPDSIAKALTARPVPGSSRIGNHPVLHRIFYVFGLVAALTAWILIIGGGVSTIAGIWVFTILWGVNNGSSVQVFYALWGSELFPAKFRAGAQGLMFFIVRGLSAIWGLVFTFIYGDNGEGFTFAAYCMVILLLTSLIVGLVGMPNTRGKSLEQITKERYGDIAVH